MTDDWKTEALKAAGMEEPEVVRMNDGNGDELPEDKRGDMWEEAQHRKQTARDAEKAPAPKKDAEATLLEIVRQKLLSVEYFGHDELLRADLPPPDWIVQDLVANEGLTMLGGKKKLGKSWLCLQIAQAVATGVDCLTRRTKQGEVVYVCLEDGKRRLKQRLIKQSANFGLPITYYTRLPPLDNIGMGNFIALIEKRTPRLVIIDTLAAAKTGKTVENDAGPMADILNSLRAISQHYKLGIIVTHHHGKSVGGDPGDDLRGSSAISGAADVNLGLYRDGDVFDLKGEGRDIEQFSLRVAFDRVTTWAWQLVGDSKDQNERSASDELLNALRDFAEADAGMLAEATGKDRASVGRRLAQLAAQGVLVCRETEGGRGKPRLLYRFSCAFEGEE